MTTRNVAATDSGGIVMHSESRIGVADSTNYSWLCLSGRQVGNSLVPAALMDVSGTQGGGTKPADIKPQSIGAKKGWFCS